jgi:divalent metal cation (Fe/Co/Zn/Cd) transporter
VLVVAAFLLLRTCEQLLIGQQADRRLMRAVETMIEDQPEVDDVVDLMTMMVGPNRVLLCARVDFVDSFSAADLENACLRIDTDLRARFADLNEIFLQPVPRADRSLRARVLARYGHELAEPESGVTPRGRGKTDGRAISPIDGNRIQEG